MRMSSDGVARGPDRQTIELSTTQDCSVYIERETFESTVTEAVATFWT